MNELSTETRWLCLSTVVLHHPRMCSRQLRWMDSMTSYTLCTPAPRNVYISVYNTLKIFHFQDAFQDLHWGLAYTVAVSCWVVGNETCAAPAAAHVFGQCRACSCSHHMVSGQPFVPSRLSHLAVHGTIDRTIRRFWVDELWWTRFHIDFILLVRNSIVQTKLEVNLYLALIERQREGPVHVVAHVWIRVRGIKIDTVSVDGYYFHPFYNLLFMSFLTACFNMFKAF